MTVELGTVGDTSREGGRGDSRTASDAFLALLPLARGFPTQCCVF